jgi:exosortase H (IPTLxxWG-CTERM-specific)
MGKNRKKRQGAKKAFCAGDPVQAPFRNRVRSSRSRFAAAFILSCIGLYGLVHVLPSSFTRPVNQHTASALGLVLNALGVRASAAGDIVSGGGLSFRIIPECTPIFAAGLFLSFVLFYPAAPREKAGGLLMGIPLLYLGNLGRLTATFIISRYDRSLFDVVHVYLGQVFTIFLVILACAAWMRRLESRPGASMRAGVFLARFALISAGLFFVWINIHHGYIWFVDRFVLFGFSLLDRRVPLERLTTYYYETFSIVVFVSLVLAARSLPPAMKAKGLAAGLGLLFLSHLIHRIGNVLLAYFNIAALAPLDLALLVIGQYLLPVLFLVFLVRVQAGEVPAVSEGLLRACGAWQRKEAREGSGRFMSGGIS